MTRPTISPTDSLAVNAMLVAVRQSADIICDRWSLSVILSAFLGAGRFNEFVELTGVTGGLLTARLRALEADGLFLKVPYSRRPLRNEYRLTNMGSEFIHVAAAMVIWEQRWNPDPGNPILRLLRSKYPALLADEPVCGACGQAIFAREMGFKVSRALLQKMPVKSTAYRRSTVDSGTTGDGRAVLGLSLDLLGDKWSIEVINCAFLGIRRFGDFKSYTGMAPNILTDRLNRLVDSGFLSRADNRKPGKPAQGYWLTEKGISFYPVLLRMQDWADAWITHRYRSPITLFHRPCGNVLRLRA